VNVEDHSTCHEKKGDGDEALVTRSRIEQLHPERQLPWVGVAAAVAGRKHVAGTRPLRTFHGIEPDVPVSAEAAKARRTTFPMRRRCST